MISQEEFDQLLPGDLVQIVNEWVPGSGQNNEGLMDKWLGEIMTVKYRDRNDLRMEEDDHDRDRFHRSGGWFWSRIMIERVVDVNEKIEFDVLLDSVF